VLLLRFPALSDKPETVEGKAPESGRPSNPPAPLSIASGQSHTNSGMVAARALKDGHADLAPMKGTMGEARVAAASAGVFRFKPSYGQGRRAGFIGRFGFPLPHFQHSAGLGIPSRERLAREPLIFSGEGRDSSGPPPPENAR